MLLTSVTIFKPYTSVMQCNAVFMNVEIYDFIDTKCWSKSNNNLHEYG